MIDENVKKFIEKCEEELKDEFKKLDNICMENSYKVLKAFKDNNVSEIHFNSTTGYGYDDLGRDVIENVFSSVLDAESSLVRNQFVSASHALNVTFFALLRPGDTLLSITGKPYDTMDSVIGLVENKSSLKSFGIKYDQVDLINDDFDYDKIKKVLLDKKIKVIEIQRSKGYSTRKSIGIKKIEKVIKFIREIDKEVIIMIDNCYCEFVESTSPLSIGADIMVGSLIKNLGGGIAPNGAYVSGKKYLVDLVGERLTLPGEGREVGPTLGVNKSLLQGIFFAPSVVNSSLKTAILTSLVMEKLGFTVEPRYNDERCDIVQNIVFNNDELLINYCKGIQSASPIDSNVTPLPSDMPGYKDKVIMAAGCFTQGSSIELSCDGPLRSPYIAYQQGSLTYEYGRLAVMLAVQNLKIIK